MTMERKARQKLKNWIEDEKHNLGSESGILKNRISDIPVEEKQRPRLW